MSMGVIAAELREHFARMIGKGYQPTSLTISHDIMRELRASGEVAMSVDLPIASAGGGGGSGRIADTLLGLPIVYVDGMPHDTIVICGAGGGGGSLAGGSGAGGGVSWSITPRRETEDERTARLLQEAVARVRNGR